MFNPSLTRTNRVNAITCNVMSIGASRVIKNALGKKLKAMNVSSFKRKLAWVVKLGLVVPLANKIFYLSRVVQIEMV